jgi:hypothetical protein
MCAEKDPAMCHRAIMISRVFHNAGYNVEHILAGDCTESQIDIEAALLNRYFPDRNQQSLLEEPSLDQLIADAYRRRNAEIGYRLGK